jgi:hypothetical protein
MTSIAFFRHHSILKTYFEKDKRAGRGIQTFNYSRAVTPPTPPKKKKTNKQKAFRPQSSLAFFRNWKNADIQVRTDTDSARVVMRRKKAESRAPGDWAKNRHPRKERPPGLPAADGDKGKTAKNAR